MNRKVNIVFLSIICSILFTASNSFAQNKEIHFEHFTVEDGLPTNSFWNLTQDYLGFMWFTTSSGLVKYDGFEFTIYQSNKNDSNSIYVSDGANIYEDKSKNLWITLVNGMSLYNRETNNFTNYLNDPNEDWTYDNIIHDIKEDYSGTLWISTNTKGVIRLVKNPEKFKSHQDIIDKSYVHDPNDSTSIPSNLIYTVFEDKSGILWFATNRGLSKYNRETDDFTTYKVDKKEAYYNKMYAIFEDSQSNLWIGTIGGGLAKFDRKKCEFEFTSFASGRDYISELPRDRNDANWLQRSIVEDYDGTFWITTSGAGLINFNPITNGFISFVHDPTNPYSLSLGSDYAHALYRDHSNVYWLTSNQGGINKFSMGKNFRHIMYNQSKQNSLSDRTVSYLLEDKEGIIWIGTSGRTLNKYNRNTENFTHYPFPASKDNSINSDYVRCIFEDSDGILWIGMHLGGIYKFEKSTGIFTSFIFDPQNPNSISNNNITAICEDDSGSLWIGNGSVSGVLTEFNKTTGEFYHHKEIRK